MMKLRQLSWLLLFLLLMGCTEGQKPTPLKRTEPKAAGEAADKTKADKVGKPE
jgi:hypothetical protein